jgi:hypothetical protein
MKAVLTVRAALLGLISWLIPFLVSFLFFDRTGQLLIPQPLFKSLMVVIFGGLGMALLIAAFRTITPSVTSGLALGCYWLTINLLLDLLVLIPFTKMPVTLYFQDIGLRYLLIPIMGAGMGIVGARASAKLSS